MTDNQKEVANEVKAQWKKLWQERFDDQERAEGVALANFSRLFVDQGTVIHATRNFKPLNLTEILERNQVENVDRYVQPNPQVGGWNKFIKTTISKSQQNAKKSAAYCPEKKEPQQPKKGGRGWLHK